jgi:hypothetical protein
MNIEGSQWLPDDKNKASNKWLRPPLFGAELPKPSQPESSLRPPIPLESFSQEKSEAPAEKEAVQLLDIPHVAEGEPFKGVPSEQWESISGRSPFSEEVEKPAPIESSAVETASPAAEAPEAIRKPRPLIARRLMELTLRSFLAERQQQRYGVLEHQLQAREERLDHQQHQANEQAARTAEASTAVRQGEQVVFDQEGNEIVLRPGWHVERSPGGFSVVLDEHGRVMHDAIKYGEAYKREQQREQLSDDLFNAISSGGVIGIPATGSDNGHQPVLPQSAPQHTGYEALPPEMVDLRHRLPKPRIRVTDTLTSPWLWTAVAILIIVYFVASLA